MKGSCLCGTVSYEVNGNIRFPRYCHCANCRKFSGTAYAARGLVRADQFNIATPDARVTKFDSGGLTGILHGMRFAAVVRAGGHAAVSRHSARCNRR
jgi:hypothetical protein